MLAEDEERKKSRVNGLEFLMECYCNRAEKTEGDFFSEPVCSSFTFPKPTYPRVHYLRK